MDTQRLILFVVFSFSILMLWDSWQKEQHPIPAQTAQNAPSQLVSTTPVPSTALSATPPATAPDLLPQMDKGEKLRVSTDTLNVVIDTAGGDIRHLELLKHHDAVDKNKNFVLLADQKPHIYVAQSGLLGNGLPSHKTRYTAQASDYRLADGAQDLRVTLTAPEIAGVKVEKIFTFHRDSYVIDVAYKIHNGSAAAIAPNAYYQLVRDESTPEGDPRFVKTYTGPAVYTDKGKFQKVSFSDIEKDKTNFEKQSKDGWVAMLQHYFFSAWLPKDGVTREFYTKKLADKLLCRGCDSARWHHCCPARDGDISVPLYAGPQEQEKLSKLAPGLDLTVDYGWLTVIAAPLFWVLSMIHKGVGNWGVAIILLTVLIKLVFYPLSAKSYRSMAHMRVLAPKLAKTQGTVWRRPPAPASGHDGSVQNREGQSIRGVFAGAWCRYPYSFRCTGCCWPAWKCAMHLSCCGFMTFPLPIPITFCPSSWVLPCLSRPSLTRRRRILFRPRL